jgi:hypothetical protein
VVAAGSLCTGAAGSSEDVASIRRAGSGSTGWRGVVTSRRGGTRDEVGAGGVALGTVTSTARCTDGGDTARSTDVTVSAGAGSAAGEVCTAGVPAVSGTSGVAADENGTAGRVGDAKGAGGSTMTAESRAAGTVRAADEGEEGRGALTPAESTAPPGWTVRLKGMPIPNRRERPSDGRGPGMCAAPSAPPGGCEGCIGASAVSRWATVTAAPAAGVRDEEGE